MVTSVRVVRGSIAAGIVAMSFAAVGIAQRRGGGAAPDGLGFRFVGPVVGNRVASIAGVPGDPSIYYAGAASGGVRKTTDGRGPCEPSAKSIPASPLCAPTVEATAPPLLPDIPDQDLSVRDNPPITRR